METGKEMELTGGFSLVPKTLDEAMQMAKLIADSELVPKDYRGKPGNVLIAVQMGAELGLKPMQAIQGIAVINGRPSIFGDIGKAILRANGYQIDEDDIETIKKTQRARCKITRRNGEVIERTFSVEDAKTAKLWGKEGAWTNYPWRQMAWRAFWFAGRDGAADALKGLSGAEEAMDYSSVIEAETVNMADYIRPRRASAAVITAANGGTVAPTAAFPKTEETADKPGPELPKTEEVPACENTVLVYLSEISFSKLPDNRIKYFIQDMEGVKYFTHEKSLAEEAKKLKTGGMIAKLTSKKAEEGLELVRVG